MKLSNLQMIKIQIIFTSLSESSPLLSLSLSIFLAFFAFLKYQKKFHKFMLKVHVMKHPFKIQDFISISLDRSMD